MAMLDQPLDGRPGPSPTRMPGLMEPARTGRAVSAADRQIRQWMMDSHISHRLAEQCRPQRHA